MTQYQDRTTAKYKTLYRDELDVILLARRPQENIGAPDATARRPEAVQ